MSTASSASRTNGRSASAAEYTATDRTPSRRAVAITRLAISPRLATRTDSSTPGSLQPRRNSAPRDLGQRLDDASVVLDPVEAQPVERGSRLVPVDRPANHVIEGIGRPDDHAAERRRRVMTNSGPALAPHKLSHVIQNAGHADDIRAEFSDPVLINGRDQDRSAA